MKGSVSLAADILRSVVTVGAVGDSNDVWTKFSHEKEGVDEEK